MRWVISSSQKLFKTRVEKFYLFFNPWFSLFKKKMGETEYGIGWLPLGGYVKISGMIDESMDKEQMKLPPQPYEFRSKAKLAETSHHAWRCTGEFYLCHRHLCHNTPYLG